eukprot:CAMPEP_0119308808 /NCGR_PEP_ID=MMETSP1333-20130426/12777_1 /TAXON_ID=418940 /ORGANISM="Scyphosphaera apsteinii, Strain RCC1455" /LENGTH=831 /DNA_ID=CAMNT_0007312663 /DNA_START=46 /DNA_END=2538 /DNA_ORIENTATION=-
MADMEAESRHLCQGYLQRNHPNGDFVILPGCSPRGTKLELTIQHNSGHIFGIGLKRSEQDVSKYTKGISNACIRCIKRSEQDESKYTKRKNSSSGSSSSALPETVAMPPIPSPALPAAVALHSMSPSSAGPPAALSSATPLANPAPPPVLVVPSTTPLPSVLWPEPAPSTDDSCDFYVDFDDEGNGYMIIISSPSTDDSCDFDVDFDNEGNGYIVSSNVDATAMDAAEVSAAWLSAPIAPATTFAATPSASQYEGQWSFLPPTSAPSASTVAAPATAFAIASVAGSATAPAITPTAALTPASALPLASLQISNVNMLDAMEPVEEASGALLEPNMAQPPAPQTTGRGVPPGCPEAAQSSDPGACAPLPSQRRYGGELLHKKVTLMIQGEEVEVEVVGYDGIRKMHDCKYKEGQHKDKTLPSLLGTQKGGTHVVKIGTDQASVAETQPDSIWQNLPLSGTPSELLASSSTELLASSSSELPTSSSTEPQSIDTAMQAYQQHARGRGGKGRGSNGTNRPGRLTQAPVGSCALPELDRKHPLLKGIEKKHIDAIWALRADSKVTWADVVGVEHIRKCLINAVVIPLRRPDFFDGPHDNPSKGLLLFGPPGTGKTMIGKAVAAQMGFHFFSVQCADIESKYHGESEKLIAALFKVGAAAKPGSIIFLDECDALLRKPGGGDDAAQTTKILNQFKTSWDGLQPTSGSASQQHPVFVICATNSPWDLDLGILRSGRLDFKVLITLPSEEGRRHLLELFLEGKEYDKSVLPLVLDATDGYSGADMALVCREALAFPRYEAFQNELPKMRALTIEDFKQALQMVRPSVSQDDLRRYDAW